MGRPAYRYQPAPPAGGTAPSIVTAVSVPPNSAGGLYRSAHAARDGDPPPPDDVPVISVDTQLPGAAAADEAVGSLDGGTAGQSAIMAAGSLVSRVIGF